ncbi:MAG: O-antigen ligase family protein, partial [Anaerolineae bacterium]
MKKQRFERALLISLGIFVVAGAVLLGGVHPAVQLALSGAALVLLLVAVSWRFRKRGAFSVGAPFWVFLALAAVCLVQLLWLPEGLLRWIQPRGAALVAYSTEGLGPLWHRCLSLDPPGTALDCCKLLGFAALAATAALLVRDPPRALLLFWTISIAGMVVAAAAAFQVLAGGKTIFGIYRPEGGHRFVAPIVNENHAGAFYAALAFLHLGLALQLREPRRRWSMVAFTALPALLVIASASRGAIAALALGALAMLVGQWRVGKINGRQLGYGIAITLILGTVALPASENVRREFGSKTTVETVQEDVKVKLWADALPMAKDYPITGIGRGAFRSVFPSYYHVSSGLRVTYSHAENLLVQLLVELGPVVFGVLLCLVIWLALRYFRRVPPTEAATIALLPVGVLLAQNLVDFNLEFPGTGFLLVVLLGALAGLHRGRTRHAQKRRRRVLAASGWLAFVAASGLALATLGAAGVRYDLRREGQELQAEINRGDKPEQTLRATREAIRR